MSRFHPVQYAWLKSGYKQAPKRTYKEQYLILCELERRIEVMGNGSVRYLIWTDAWYSEIIREALKDEQCN